MKRLLFLMLGLTIAVGASAGVETWQQVQKKQHNLVERRGGAPKLNPFQAWANQVAGKPKPAATLKAKSSGPITEIPSDYQTVTFYRSDGGALYTDAEHNYHSESQNSDNTIILALNESELTVYIKNILYKTDEVMDDYWVQGTIDPSDFTIHIPLGQVIQQNKDYDLILEKGSISTDENNELVFDIETPEPGDPYEIVYQVNNGETIFMYGTKEVPPYDGYHATGLCCVRSDDHSFGGFLEWETEFTLDQEQPDEPIVITDQPFGEMVTYQRSGGCHYFYNGSTQDQSGLVNIVYAPDGETVYIQDIIAGEQIGSWVRGTINGNKITVPLGQHIYAYYDDNNVYQYGLLLAWGSYGTCTDLPDMSNTYLNDKSVIEVTYTINGNTISLDNSEVDINSNGDVVGAIGLAANWNDGYGGDAIEWNTMFTELVIPSVIDQQPDGELVTYLRHNQGISYEYSTSDIIDASDVYNVVYASDGETVYVQDPVSLIPTGAWVRGTVNGNTITVPLGQYVFYNNRFGVITAWGTNVWDGESFYCNPDASVTELTYTINGDYLVMNNTTAGDSGEGATGPILMMDNGNMIFAIEWTVPLALTVIDEEPEGELIEYDRSGEGIYPNDPLNLNKDRDIRTPNFSLQTGKFRVIYDPDGETVYLQDIVDCGTYFNRGTWVKGTLSENGTKITVPLGQAVGYSNNTGKYEVIAWGTTSVGEPDEYGHERVIFTPDASAQAVTFTIQDGRIAMEGSVGASYEDINTLYYQYYSNQIDADTFQERLAQLCQNTGLAYITTDGEWTGEANWGTKLSLQHAAVPADPMVWEWYDSEDENGNSHLSFDLPMTDVDGYALTPQGISISIYTDNDELFTFGAEQYNLDADVTEYPYLSEELQPSQNFWFYRTNAEGFDRFFDWRIGVQVHYTVDGIKNSSNIVYLEVFDEPEQPNVKPGDVNGDSLVNISDVILLINYVSNGDSVSIVEGNADYNGDTLINISDVISLLNFLSDN